MIRKLVFFFQKDEQYKVDKTGEIGGRGRNCLVGGQNGRRAAESEMGE